jgi:hypothetical protein
MDLRLKLRIQPSDVRVQLINPTDHPVRVWRLGNSWGGSSWSLRLSTTGASARSYVLRPTNQGYTRNVPGFIEIPQHGQSEIQLVPSRPEWTAGEDIGALKGVVVNAQAVLEIAPTPESAKHHVAVGRMESAPVLSRPPHAWLFDAA